MSQRASAAVLDLGSSLPVTMRRSSFLDRLLARRDRILASPDFQRHAARFLPTRWIARRRARALFDLVAGFTYSQVLLACVRLGWFDRLLAAPCTIAELVEASGLDTHAVERLVAAAVSLRLLERRRGERIGLGALGAAMAGNAGIAAMVEHHAALYADLADPIALLKRRPVHGPASSADGTTNALNAVWGYAANDAAPALTASRVAGYSALMTQSQPLVADQVLDAYPLTRHRRLLDVGGGEGAFAIAAATRHRHLDVAVFDLPAVAARAHARLQAAGLAGRATTHGGDFASDPLATGFDPLPKGVDPLPKGVDPLAKGVDPLPKGFDQLPKGFDLITLVRVIHDHDDERALRILRNVHAALPDGGVLLLAEPMSGTAGAEPMGDAYFGLYLFAMGSGRPRTAVELSSMLRTAGFRQVRSRPTSLPIQTRVLIARK